MISLDTQHISSVGRVLKQVYPSLPVVLTKKNLGPWVSLPSAFTRLLLDLLHMQFSITSLYLDIQQKVAIY